MLNSLLNAAREESIRRNLDSTVNSTINALKVPLSRYMSSHRMETVRNLEEELFVLMTLGDDRAVRQTYIAGEPMLRR